VTLHSDVLVIGGGVAGLSAAAALAKHGRVTVLEAEDQIGFHSSGRSATMLHYALGDSLVRALTQASKSFFESPPDDFGESPLSLRMPVLVHARDDERAALERLEAEIAPFATLDRLDEAQIAALCPLLRVGEGGARHAIADRGALRLDPHALLQGYLRQLRRNGGTLHTGARIVRIERTPDGWRVLTESGDAFEAPLLINAGGAWAGAVAQLAGVQPIALEPKRRTIITFDAPPGTALDGLPFAKTVGDELYFAPESGRLLASPMDEVPTDPCDAQPDEFEVALAAHRMEQRTVVAVGRIHSRWAGLRTFAPDRRPVVGYAPADDAFFWLAGQGGFGLQTAPAIAQIVEALVARSAWPAPGISPDALSPGRFLGQPA
jgi:D-arginine dehydrogenase